MGNDAAEALRYLDDILAAEPRADQHLFSCCIQALTRLRDGLADAQAREGGTRPSLQHVNAIISVVMAGQFPLGKLPWQELHTARSWLAAV